MLLEVSYRIPKLNTEIRSAQSQRSCGILLNIGHTLWRLSFERNFRFKISVKFSGSSKKKKNSQIKCRKYYTYTYVTVRWKCIKNRVMVREGPRLSFHHQFPSSQKCLQAWGRERGGGGGWVGEWRGGGDGWDGGWRAIISWNFFKLPSHWGKNHEQHLDSK